MAKKPPSNPLFDNAPGAYRPAQGRDSIATPQEAEQVEKLRSRLGSLLEQINRGSRAERFLPYLLIRSFTGDRGSRPFGMPFWESPDIWIVPGDPTSAPRIPASPGGSVTVGLAHTLYAHVWNLGRAPIIGVKMEFFWFEPNLGINGSKANLIGITSVDLPPRNSIHCHTLVKCPSAWIPVAENAGHECLLVRASCIGDPLTDAGQWSPETDRHVALRSLSAARIGSDVSRLIESFERNRFPEARVVLESLGSDNQPVLNLLRPDLSLAPNQGTSLLAASAPGASLSEADPAVGEVSVSASLKLGAGIGAVEGAGAVLKRLSAFRGDRLVGGYTVGFQPLVLF